MRGMKMNMTPDGVWTGLGDSVRQDLAQLPGLSDGAPRAGCRHTSLGYGG